MKKTKQLKVLLSFLLLFATSLGALAQQKTISGRITDKNGEGVPLVSIIVKGTLKGELSDDEGNYSITIPSNINSPVLLFSSVGFKDKEVAVSDERVVNVVLESDVSLLEEAVVVGFGKQRKESVVGAVQTVKPQELRIQSNQLSSSFAGRIAGVIAVQRSGEPGADGANFWIRGISTFAGPTSPLIFIDNVEVSAADLNALAPEVIEGFSVLKDATATALYGARGANGVILVTTRQGQNMEKARVNVRFQSSITAPTKTVKFADGVDYMNAFNEAKRTRNQDIMFSPEKIEATKAGKNKLIFPNVDWQDFLFKDFSMSQTANLNVTGGGSRVVYFMSATLNNDNGMLKKDPQNQFNNNVRQMRIGFQGNIGADITKTTKATLRINSQVIDYSGSHLVTSTLYYYMFETSPVLFAPYFPNTIGADHTLFGNLDGGPIPDNGGNLYRNPYASMVSGYRKTSESTNIASFELEQKLDMLTEGLKMRGMISIKNWSTTSVTRSFVPYYYQISKYKENPDGTFDYNLQSLTKGSTALTTSSSTNGDRFMNLEFLASYQRTFNKHDVGAMLVYLQRDYNSNNPGGDYYLSLPTRNQGVSGRLTYAYDNRYLIEANFGYNGSENFAKGKRFGFFPSAAVGYNISNESFFSPLKNVISNLKLRASWGIVGNSFTDPRFPYLTFVNLGGQGYTFGDDWQNSRSGAVVTKYGAPNAQWEEGRKSNIGIDLTLFNSLTIIADIFQEKRTGIFMQRQVIAAETGITSSLRPYANLGKVNSGGFDMSVEFNKAFLNNDLIISVRGSFTYAKNKLIDRDEPEYEFSYQSDLNQPLNRYRALVAEGLFKSDDEVANSPEQTFSPNVKAGDIKYKDMNGDGKIDNNDRVQMGSPSVPQIVYGFGMSVQYKKFDFSTFFQGIAKTSLMMNDIHPFTTDYTNLFQFIAEDYWTEANPNPDAKYPRLVSNTTRYSHNNFQNSSFWLRDASFLRLKNVEIGYTYKMLRVFVAGQNLLTFSPFKHWDAELGGGNGMKYPNLRVGTIGAQLTF